MMTHLPIGLNVVVKLTVSPTVPRADETSNMARKNSSFRSGASVWLPSIPSASLTFATGAVLWDTERSCKLDCSTINSARQRNPRRSQEQHNAGHRSIDRILRDRATKDVDDVLALKTALSMDHEHHHGRYLDPTGGGAGAGSDGHQGNREEQAGIGEFRQVDGVEACRATRNGMEAGDEHKLHQRGIGQHAIPFQHHESKATTDQQDHRSQQGDLGVDV